MIVGAGAAGCVLAARLSEDPARRVILLEAGPDYPPPDALPEDLDSGWGPTFSHDWGYESEPDRSGARRPVTRARLVGGCSATNATFALRGSPADYEDWGEGWRWDDVLPCFCKLESDFDFAAEPWHGDSGPLPIRRYPREELTDWQAAGLQALEERGHPFVPDHNQPGAIGAGQLPVNTINGRRISVATAYLAQARSRPNLEIRPNALVDRVVIQGERAIGVEVDGELIEAGCVVLSAGAIGSPALLMRSGIGDPEQLSAAGIPAAVQLPGVGANLIDHPLCLLEVPVRAPERPGPRYQIVATWSSTTKPAGQPYDMQHVISGPRHALAESETGWLAAISAPLMKPRSRGSVRLRSSDPTTPPVIELGFLNDPADQPRLAEGIERCNALLATDALAPLLTGTPPELQDPNQVALSASTYFHPVGTCRLGNDPSHGAVVDPRCRVHGVEKLRVADASVMPDIPAANTHLPAIMIAERVSQWLTS